MPLITRLTRKYKRSFLLRLTGFNDADMINFFDEAGSRITPSALQRKRSGVPLGPTVAGLRNPMRNALHPFSSMHRYRREDSAWANECTTPVEAHAIGFDSKRCSILPAFIRYDLLADRMVPINPQLEPAVVLPPRDFGDAWSDDLEGEELEIAARYFRRIDHLRRLLDYINLRNRRAGPCHRALPAQLQAAA